MLKGVQKGDEVLTESQKKTLQVIKDYILANGFAPTISEILKAMQINSRSLIQRNLASLADEGVIRLVPNKRRNIELIEEEEAGLPLVGRIAAGQPIEAIPSPEVLNISELFLGADRYLLEVKGDSMIGDNICDGDLVVCQHSNTAREGDIVVALVDSEAATLKRIHYDKPTNTISLIPSNPTLLPMEYRSDRVAIQGIYLGLIRMSH